MNEQESQLGPFLRSLGNPEFEQICRLFKLAPRNLDGGTSVTEDQWRANKIIGILGSKESNPKFYNSVILQALPKSPGGLILLRRLLSMSDPQLLDFYRRVFPARASDVLHTGARPGFMQEILDLEVTVPTDWRRALELAGLTPTHDAVSPSADSVPTVIPQALRIFIVHGHDEARRMELENLLRDRFRIPYVIMQEQPGRSRTFIEKFEQEAQPCTAAIAILTPDDLIEGEEQQRQPRPNVMYELGWFAGRLGRDRTVMLVKTGTNTPSDLLGIEQIRFATKISEVIVQLEREIDEWRKTLGMVQ